MNSTAIIMLPFIVRKKVKKNRIVYGDDLDRYSAVPYA